MGKLVKNHLGRLVVLTAAFYQLAAAFECFFWPKLFWDFSTKTLDNAVKPFPILQIVNIVLGLVCIAFEYPAGFIRGYAFHRSIETRLVLFPMAALSAALIYQGTNPALYYLIGIVLYFWAYTEGEVVCSQPWTLPKKGKATPKV